MHEDCHDNNNSESSDVVKVSFEFNNDYHKNLNLRLICVKAMYCFKLNKNKIMFLIYLSIS